jgi:hypothetical protein
VVFVGSPSLLPRRRFVCSAIIILRTFPPDFRFERNRVSIKYLSLLLLLLLLILLLLLLL